MGFPKYFFLAFLLLLLLLAHSMNGQIIFKELPQYKIKLSDSTFFDLNEKREIISLNGDWKVYDASDNDMKKVGVEIPSIFQGSGEFVFEKMFSISQAQFENYKMRIFFLGLNYTADISVNNIIIYRHSGGTFPFQVELPKDIIHTDKQNVLSVKLYYKLDSENTIPVKQRFLFPKSFGGIIRDVYIALIPNVSISNLNVNYKADIRTNRVNIDILSKIENKEFRKINDSLNTGKDFTLRVKLISPEGYTQNLQNYQFTLEPNREKNIKEHLEVYSPSLWSPSNPVSYIVIAEIWRNGILLDKTKHPLAIYSLSTTADSLTLNGSSFSINGVTYIPSFDDYGNLATYDQMENDIKMIKNLGFNSIRFAKSVPHPYYLRLCEKYGLLAFIEIPLNDIPSSLTKNINFIARSKYYLTNFIKAYHKYSAVAAIGVGSSYLPELDSHRAFITNLVSIVKNESNALTYASFVNYNVITIPGLDLYGIELFNTPISKIDSKLQNLEKVLGVGKIFISEASYTVTAGNTDGYVNEHSFEAQAKYFEDLIDYSKDNPLSGYFINTMFDYRGDYASLVAGYNKENIYQLGISGENRNTSRLAYKVIYAKLHNAEKVTIPIGSHKDNAPMAFIIYGIILALILGALVNSGRKFREDSSRALLRPYNFYADVRDQRIMSGYHSTVLAVVVSATMALLVGNLLSFVKQNIVFEKLLLAFGSKNIMHTVSYLSWHPLHSLLLLTVIFGISLLILIVVIKAASFFVRNRVFLSSVYFTVIWSFLPLILLIPLGIVLYRVLSADVANLYVYTGLIAFSFWVFYRLMKGIYVIFDVNAGSVYFYSILMVLLVFGGILFYFEVHNSAIEYLQLTIQQYKIFG